MGLFQELKRRNVIKVTIAYIIVAWLLLQVSDTLVPALYLPDWFQSGIVVLLILGFPIAGIFAWAFEMTPEGIKHERDVDRSQSITGPTGRKIDYFIITALLIILGYFIWESRYKQERALPEEAVLVEAAEGDEAGDDGTTAGKSIAVLPFVNMTNDPGQEYFSDGVSEELLNVLAKYPGLRVAARTSSFQFKGQSPDIREIAEKLNVNHVLEGSVRRSGTRIRITAQLIETESGFHLWSETFDREQDDIFAIQDEISAAIGAALEIHLELDSGISAPTVSEAASSAAFESYLRGRQLINLRGRQNLEDAVSHLEKALEYDANYAPAHAQLAIAIVMLNNTSGGYGDLTMEEVERRAGAHIEKAFELDKNLPEAYAARAIYSLVILDFDAVIDNANSALALNPSYIDVINWSYIAYGGAGKYVEATRALEHLIEVDPMSVAGRTNLAPDLAISGNVEAAHAMAEGILAQNPSVSYITHGMISLEAEGKPAEALGWFLQALVLDRGSSFSNDYSSRVFGILDLLPEAMQLREDTRQWAYRNLKMWPELIADNRQRLENDPLNPVSKMYLADALHLSGEVEQAQVLYEDLLTEREGKLIVDQILESTIPTARAAFGRLKTGDMEGTAMLVDLLIKDQQQVSLADRRDGQYYRIEAILKMLEGYEALALLNIEAAINAGHRDRSIFAEPAFTVIRNTEKFQALESGLATILAGERRKALQMICFNNPVVSSWQPQPETCAGIVAAL